MTNNRPAIQKASLFIAIFALNSFAGLSHSYAQNMGQKPVLTITNKPMVMRNNNLPIYNSPTRAPEITAEQVKAEAYFEQGKTVVGRRIDGLQKDLFSLESSIENLSKKLRGIEGGGQDLAAEYYASLATINTCLLYTSDAADE